MVPEGAETPTMRLEGESMEVNFVVVMLTVFQSPDKCKNELIPNLSVCLGTAKNVESEINKSTFIPDVASARKEFLKDEKATCNPVPSIEILVFCIEVF